MDGQFPGSPQPRQKAKCKEAAQNPHSCGSSDLIGMAALTHTNPLYDALRARKHPSSGVQADRPPKSKIRPARFQPKAVCANGFGICSPRNP